ncbi:MAG: hypothetical protein QNJ90_04775 [Planctomycetota bacterium]|nr:hypothetical protein [Planctomycetota bacterium]
MRPPAPTDRPTLASARRTNWKVFLLQEWGLLLLAAALAVIIWEITSRRVLKTHTLDDVEIQLVVDPAIRDRVGAVITGKVTKDFELFCSEREKDEALEALNVDGRPVVTMRITQPIESGKRDLNARLDKYDWPFANHHRILVQASADAPAGEVFALAEAHPRVSWPDDDEATLPRRSELAKRGIEVRIKVSQDKIDLMAPKGREDDPGWTFLSPDPINLTSVAGELVAYDDIPFDRPQRYDLEFEGWIQTDDTTWRRGLKIPTLSATVTLVETGEMPLQNRVIMQLPQEYQADLDRQAIPGVNVGGKLLFTGQLKGPKKDLEALQKDPSAWAWGIEVQDAAELPDGTMNAGPSEWKTVRARFVWYPTKPEFRDAGIEFQPKPGQDDFDIKVRWNKRKR